MLSAPPGSTMVVPAPSYGHPFYGRGYPQGWAGGSDPAWESGAERGTSVFVGGCGAIVGAVGPVLAPGAGGFKAQLEVDDRKILHAKICIDGKCYETSFDLKPAIDAVMKQAIQYHHDLHAAEAAAVKTAGDSLVGALVGRHVDAVCGSFLDDIGNALKGIGSTIEHGVQDTVSALKGPIEMAAGAAATMIPGVGPVVAPMAAKLVGPILDQVTGGKPNPQVQAAQQAAKTDPQAAQALSAAKQATAHSIAAHHVTVVARRAAAGDPAAQQQVQEVQAQAAAGHPVAQAAAPLVQQGLEQGRAAAVPGSSAWYRHSARRPLIDAKRKYRRQGFSIGGLGYLATGGHHTVYPFRSIEEGQAWYGQNVSGQYSYIGLFDARNLHDPIVEGIGSIPPTVSGSIVGAVADLRAHAKMIATGKAGGAVGVIQRGGTWFAVTFHSSDDADDWFGHVIAEPGSFTYAAYFSKAMDGTAALENEQIGGARVPSMPGQLIPRGFGTI